VDERGGDHENLPDFFDTKIVERRRNKALDHC
jgi:hypothetical protein